MLHLMPGDIAKRRFSADEYQLMGEAGILSADDRVELIDGEVVEMTPIGTVHTSAVMRATSALFQAAGTRAGVRVQSPIRLGNFSEPEPDLALVRWRDDFYGTAHPGPDDVLLVIEMADTSLRYDRLIKVPLYARHGIVEYWLVDLTASAITCYTSPHGDTYRKMSGHGPGETLSPGSFPDIRIATNDLLNQPGSTQADSGLTDP